MSDPKPVVRTALFGRLTRLLVGVALLLVGFFGVDNSVSLARNMWTKIHVSFASLWVLGSVATVSNAVKSKGPATSSKSAKTRGPRFGVNVEGHTGQMSCLMGRYIYDGILNDLPSFKKKVAPEDCHHSGVNGRAVYLYRADNGKWLIGDEKGVDGAWIHSHNELENPATGNMVWKTLVNNRWRTDQQMQVTCGKPDAPRFDRLIGKARCAFGFKDYTRAINYAGDALRVERNHPQALLWRGKAFYHMDQMDNALKHFKAGLRTDPDNKKLKKVYKSLKKLKRHLNNASDEDASYSERIEMIEDAEDHVGESNPKVLKRILKRKCEISISATEHDVSLPKRSRPILVCTKSLDMDNESPMAWVMRGKANFAEEKYDEALSDHEQAVNLDQHDMSTGHKFINMREAMKKKVSKAKRKDYYKILDTFEWATPKQIKKSFRQCGRKYHPDRARGNEDKREKFEVIFKECVEAHDILSDPAIREKYDDGEDVLADQQNKGRNQGGGFGFGGGQRFYFRSGGFSGFNFHF